MILSNRQYPTLKLFFDTPEGLSIEEAQRYDQRPFRSMLYRKYVRYFPSVKRFRITADGRNAYLQFLATDILRKNSFGPLTSYFDPSAYRGLKIVTRAAA